MNAPLASVYKKVANEKSRSLWLSEDAVTIKKSTQQVNAHGLERWQDELQISFLEKADGKSQVVVQHGKLPDPKAAAKMKSYWGKALNRLQKLLNDFLSNPGSHRLP